MPIRNILLFLLFISCNPSNEVKTQNQFFQLKEYFHDQSEQLQKKNVSLQKSISKDGKVENKNIVTLNWSKELQPFEDCDLNKPAWRKSYKADTFFLANQTHLIYKALEPKLAVRKLEVIIREDTVYMVNILIAKKNSYYQSTQQLNFIPGKGYTITGSQKVIFADPTTFLIKANFN